MDKYAEEIANEVFREHKLEAVSRESLLRMLAEAATKGYVLGLGVSNA